MGTVTLVGGGSYHFRNTDLNGLVFVCIIGMSIQDHIAGFKRLMNDVFLLVFALGVIIMKHSIKRLEAVDMYGCRVGSGGKWFSSCDIFVGAIFDDIPSLFVYEFTL